MPLKDKIKHILHPHGHKKTPSTSSSNSSPVSSPVAAKPDPNKPPNARDPGFRKSFNLGERVPTDPPTTEEISGPTDAKSVQQSGAQNVPAKKKMYTLDKDGGD